MKISNNALNFLLAQYRAIFKRAYVKGIASAVILTAALAAGQAQATNANGILDPDSFATASGSAQDITVTVDSNVDLGDSEYSDKFGGTWTYLKDTVIDGADVVITGEANKSISIEGATNGLKIQNGGSLTISNTKTTNTQIFGGTNGNSRTITVTGDGSALNINSASINFNQASITDGATVTLGGSVDYNLKAAGDSSEADWAYYSNIGANLNSANSGTITVDESTVNLNDSSLMTADKTFNISGSTINFAGKEHVLGKDEDGNQIQGASYATAFLRAGNGANTVQGTLTIAGKTVAGQTNPIKSTINVADNAWGALYANTISISDTDAKIGSGATFILDGNFEDRTIANQGQHKATNLTLEDVKFDNQGTVIIGNATSNSSGTVTGTVDLRGDVKNFAKVTISGDSDAPGRLIISEDQILKQKDADKKPIAAGWFAGSNSEIVLSGDSFDGAVLQLKDTDSDGLDLNKDITFASQADTVASPATTAGKIYVQKSGTLAGEHFVLKEALSLPTAGKLALEADTFEIGKTDGAADSLADFKAEAYAAHDRIDLNTSGDVFGIDRPLTLSRDYYVKDADGINTTTENGTGLIQGDDLLIKGSSSLTEGNLTIAGGAWRNEGQNLTVNWGSLNINAGADTKAPVHVNDGADSTGWSYQTNGNPASLTWTGNFNIEGLGDQAGSATVNVTGALGADATLDLTGATISWGAGTINLQGSINDDGDAYQVSATDYFARAGHGILTLTGNQFSDFLDLQKDQDPADATKTQMVLSDGGLLLVKGAVTGPINFNKFTKDSDPVAAGNVHFSGAGLLLSTGDLSLETGVDLNDDGEVEEASEVQSLNLGDGMIGAVGISINNRNPELNDPENLADDYVTVSGGALGVTSRFDSSNNEVRFVESDLVLDSAGLLSQYGVTSTGSGVAAVNKLTFSGSESDLYVETGDWTVGTGGVLGDIELQDQASVSVGAGEAEFSRNGIAASLEADNLSIGNGDLTIAAGGSATFNTIQAGTGSSITINDGSLTLTGNVTDTDIEADNVPESLADLGTTLDDVKAQAGIALNDATITVNHGELVLGDTAANALVKFSATEDPDTGYVAVNAALAEADITLTDASVLKLDFSESSAAAINGTGKISNVQARELKDELVDALERGSYINVGQLGLDIIYDETDMTAQWSDLKDFVHVVSGQVGNNVTEQLLVKGITSSDNDISGQFGALETATVGQNSIRVDGTLGLHQARENYFASQVGADGTRSAVGLTLNSYSDVTLHGAGTVGTLQGSSTGDDTLLVFAEGTYAPGATTVEATTGTNGIVNIGRVEVDNDVVVEGDVKVGSLEVTKTLTAENVSLDGGANGSSAVFGTMEVNKTLTVGTTGSTNELYVANGSVTADELALFNGSTLYVGWDGAAEDVNGTDIDETKSYSGQFYAGTVDLGNGGIVVDPAATDPTAIAAFGQFRNGTKSETSYDLGSANGNLFVGQNSALGLGFDSAADLQDYIAAHQTNGSLTEYKAIAAVNGTFDLTSGYGLTMTQDSFADFVTYMQDKGWSVNTQYGTVANTVYFGANTALKISAEAMDDAVRTNQAVITLAGNDGTLIDDGGSILISGEVRAQSYQLFSDADGKVAVVDIDNKQVADGSGIAVSTENGFLIGEINNTNGGLVDLTVNPESRGLMSGASDPVYDTLVVYAQGYKVVGHDDQGNEVHEDLYDGYTGQTDANGNPVKDYGYSNYYLDQVISTGNGSDAEAVARLGVYGGAPQAAIKAGQSSTDAIAARFGIGSSLSSLTVAGNTQGAALWLAPVYKTSDSDGFDAQGVDYGVNVDLYGVALGADFTLANGMTFGAMFNVGSGEVDGEGAASPVSNDFDYYGFGAYAGYTVGQFSVVGDISYTVADNEVEASTSVDHIGATMDSTNLSVGVTGKYELSFNGVNVTPHVGLRFSNIDLDDYTIDGNEVVASADSDKLNLFSIPVGVTIAKEFKGESWTVAPSLDLTLTGQFGDDELDGSVSWAGVSNLTTDTTTEVFDNFTYGATLGVEAQSVGGVALGINVGYTGSSNVDEFGVKANARFTF